MWFPKRVMIHSPFWGSCEVLPSDLLCVIFLGFFCLFTPSFPFHLVYWKSNPAPPSPLGLKQLKCPQQWNGTQRRTPNSTDFRPQGDARAGSRPWATAGACCGGRLHFTNPFQSIPVVPSIALYWTKCFPAHAELSASCTAATKCCWNVGDRGMQYFPFFLCIIWPWHFFFAFSLCFPFFHLKMNLSADNFCLLKIFFWKTSQSPPRGGLETRNTTKNNHGKEKNASLILCAGFMGACFASIKPSFCPFWEHFDSGNFQNYPEKQVNQ